MKLKSLGPTAEPVSEYDGLHELHTIIQNLHNTEVNLVAGKTRANFEAWKELTSDANILSWVAGVNIDFNAVIQQNNLPRPIVFNQTDSLLIDSEIQKMLEKKVIERCANSEGQFISNIFLRHKRDGSIRIILNLKELNLDVEYHHFKMETLQHAILSMTPGCFMASVDLKQAYYAIPVSQSDRKYLRFFWKGRLFQFTCLPNGLAEAPRKFTKILKVLFATLRASGHDNSAYVDDSCLLGTSFDSCVRNVIDTVLLMDKLGFTVHPNKSCFVPTQILVYLGFILNSIAMTVKLTDEKADKITQKCLALLRKEHCTIRECATVLGSLVAAEPGVEMAPIHYKRTEHEKIRFLKLAEGDYEAKMPITPYIRQDLSWWTENAKSAIRRINHDSPSIILESDSSNFAWGGVYMKKVTGGPWIGEELEWHINVKELKAAFFTLKAFCAQQTQVHVRLMVDNMSTVAYINNKGGKKPFLNSIAREMWMWAADRDLWLSAAHIPGVENTQADRASRKKYDTDTEWMLHREVFSKLNESLGPFQVDLFASRTNTQCARFFAWQPDPDAMGIDALAHIWPDAKLYAFPPFSILGRVLQQITLQRVEVLLVAPMWTSQPWFGRMLQMCAGPPLILPKRQDLVVLPQSPQRVHQLINKLHLMACPLSGNISVAQAYQKTLPKSSSPHGGAVHSNSTGRIGPNGSHFVVGGRSLHCKFLCRY